MRKLGWFFLAGGLLLLANSIRAATSDGEEQGELQFSEVGLQLLPLVPNGKRGPEQVRLTLTNAGSRTGMYRLPSPFGVTNASKSSFAPFPPYLALLVKEPKSGNEEQFVLTSLRKLRGPGKRISLKPGQVRHLEYPLGSFYLCGPEGPREAGRFTDCLKPGASELEVRAVIFNINSEPKILSNPQILRCSFPDWLFKGPFKAEHNAPPL